MERGANAGQRESWSRRLFRPRLGPDRDTGRQYLVIGFLGGSLVVAGILIGVFGDDPAPAVAPASPVPTADASPEPLARDPG